MRTLRLPLLAMLAALALLLLAALTIAAPPDSPLRPTKASALGKVKCDKGLDGQERPGSADKTIVTRSDPAHPSRFEKKTNTTYRPGSSSPLVASCRSDRRLWCHRHPPTATRHIAFMVSMALDDFVRRAHRRLKSVVTRVKRDGKRPILGPHSPIALW